MKRTVILIVAAWVCCTAEAALKITVDGVVDPPDSVVILAPSEHAVIGVWSDGPHMLGAYYLGVSKGHPGALDAGRDCSWPPMPGPEPEYPCNIRDPEMGELLGVTLPFVYFEIMEFLPPGPSEGMVVDGIDFHCMDIGDVLLILFDGDGNVLDTQVIHQDAGADFGDCPAPYPTLLADDGARHEAFTNVFLGQFRDREADGQPTALADGDDSNFVDDEDGVEWLSKIVPGYSADVRVAAANEGLLDAYMDFNVDGDWADPGERIFNSFPLSTGYNELTFNVPAGAVIGGSYARFRFSTVGGLGPTGLAPDGEVEDYNTVTEYCFPEQLGIPGDPVYADFVTFKQCSDNPLRIDCWCPWPYGSGYQCDGDADGQTETLLKYRIYTHDYRCIVDNWKKKLCDPGFDPCCDFDHKAETLMKYRVYINDFNILVANWKKKDADLPGNCPRPDGF